MGNVLYGVGVDFVDGVSNSASTVFAYQGIVDTGWNSTAAS
jgi:hypothetical protein